jgi:hypothetical protein
MLDEYAGEDCCASCGEPSTGDLCPSCCAEALWTGWTPTERLASATVAGEPVDAGVLNEALHRHATRSTTRRWTA